jgi:hypothetical protein
MHFLLRDEPLHDYSTKVAVTEPFWSGRKWNRRMIGLLVSGTGLMAIRPMVFSPGLRLFDCVSV